MLNNIGSKIALLFSFNERKELSTIGNFPSKQECAFSCNVSWKIYILRESAFNVLKQNWPELPADLRDRYLTEIKGSWMMARGLF